MEYRIRELLRRWRAQKSIRMTDESILIIDYVRQKPNGRVVELDLRLVNDSTDVYEEFYDRGKQCERNANSWLSDMYRKYDMQPNTFVNDYWEGCAFLDDLL